VRRSRVVIVICQQLVEVVRAIDPLVPTVLIENAPGSGDLPVAGASPSLRAAWGIAADVPVVLYTGTFEAYQGLDLLYAAAARVRATRPDVRFLVVGGQPDQVAAARLQAKAAGAGDVVVFTGQRPSEEIPQFLDAATVLASPRSRGTNTPLKIYQYLRAGRPIIATRLLTHTQVLDDSVAVLTEATPESYAAGILRAVDDPAEADAIGRRARELADTKYSYEAYLERTRHAYAELFGSGAAQVARGVA
jgi:glycosyltransferase involved in cell wall biosynthesis